MGAFCSFCPRVIPPRTEPASRAYDRIVDQEPTKIKVNQQQSSSTTATNATVNQIQMKNNPIPPLKPEVVVAQHESKVAPSVRYN